MKKKIIAFLIGICTVATMAGCGNKEVSNDLITIKQYKGLEVVKTEAAEVTDKEVEDSINSTLQTRSTEKEITDRAAQEGDLVTIDFEGKKDGVAFSGGKAEDEQITIGQAGYIDGFEDGIIGHNPGDTFDLNLTFPDEYELNPDLAGQDVVFTITLDKISEKIVPELTDELVAEISEESKTIEEFKKEVRKDLEESNKQAAEAELRNNMWEALLGQCTVDKYPEDEKQEVVDQLNTQYGTVAQMYGMVDAETVVQQMYGVSVEEMAENMLKQRYAIELISKKEKLTVSDKDYKEGLEEFTERYGYSSTSDLEEAVGKEEIEKAILQEKVTELIMDNMKLVEKKEEK